MINFDDNINENTTEYNIHCPQTLALSFLLNIGTLELGKTNALLNLIKSTREFQN